MKLFQILEWTNLVFKIETKSTNFTLRFLCGNTVFFWFYTELSVGSELSSRCCITFFSITISLLSHLVYDLRPKKRTEFRWKKRISRDTDNEERILAVASYLWKWAVTLPKIVGVYRLPSEKATIRTELTIIDLKWLEEKGKHKNNILKLNCNLCSLSFFLSLLSGRLVGFWSYNILCIYFHLNSFFKQFILSKCLIKMIASPIGFFFQFNLVLFSLSIIKKRKTNWLII